MAGLKNTDLLYVKKIFGKAFDLDANNQVRVRQLIRQPERMEVTVSTEPEPQVFLVEIVSGRWLGPDEYREGPDGFMRLT